MRMTFDKTIEFFNGLECHTPQAKDARDVAINTMRKYQKIVQIYQKWNRNYDIQTSSAWTEVIEVIEDGNS